MEDDQPDIHYFVVIEPRRRGDIGRRMREIGDGVTSFELAMLMYRTLWPNIEQVEVVEAVMRVLWPGAYEELVDSGFIARVMYPIEVLEMFNHFDSFGAPVTTHSVGDAADLLLRAGIPAHQIDRRLGLPARGPRPRTVPAGRVRRALMTWQHFHVPPPGAAHVRE